MGKKSTQSISPNFQSVAYLPSFEMPVDFQLKRRNDAFYGAVFNAIDDFLRKNHATGIPASDIITAYSVKDDKFRLITKVRCQNDNPAEIGNDAITGFFEKIYDAIDSEELLDVRSHHHFSHKNGAQHTYVLIFSNKLELMQLVENLLKPYDFSEGRFPYPWDHKLTEESPLRFEMYPQYSLKHIRALLHSTQGRSPEGQGLHLSH